MCPIKTDKNFTDFRSKSSSQEHWAQGKDAQCLANRSYRVAAGVFQQDKKDDQGN